MIHPFEENYFYTPDKTLMKLPGRQTHSEWLKINKPDETRESLCEKGWQVIRTFRDRHVIQLHGMSHGKLRDIHDILFLLPSKDIIVIQTALRLAYQMSIAEFWEIDDPIQLHAHKI
jgi:hypothetical protein